MKALHFFRYFLFTILNLAISLLLTAQQGKDTTRIIDLDEVVVTATKTQVSRSNVPLTVSVVTREAIENSSESALMPVLSEMVPGLFVTERGITGFGVSAGSAGQISLRGIGGNPNTQLLVLVNGNPQFMGIMGHPLADAYIASDAERVEVIRGPASTLYGTNAMGGVINIITKEQKEEGFKANARVMIGSYNTQKYSVNGGYRKGKMDVYASFNRDHTDGHRDSSDFTINNGYLKAGYEISRHIKLNADFSLANFDATDPGPENGVAGYAIDITRGMGSVSLDNRFDRTNGSVRFFYNFGEHHITDGFHSTDNNYGIAIYQAFQWFKGNTLTVGTDYKKYGGLAENIKAMGGMGIVFADTSIWEAAGYVYMQQSLFNRLTLNAGFRLEHNSVYGNEPVPTGGLAFRASSTTSFKASVANGFRSPSLRELYLWGTANPDLSPEKMVNYEAGIIQRFMKDKLSVEMTAFISKGDNLIVALAGTNGMKYQNSGTFSNTGIEFSGTYKPVSRLIVMANYSYISMKRPILATPEQQLFISGTYKWNKLGVNLSLQHIHNLYTRVGPNPEVRDSYTLLNTRIAYAFSKYFDVFVKGENLTNQKYYINYNYPMPGFIGFVGLNLHL